MPDWLTYRLSDLLLFSPRTYFRTFELYHLRVWPAQLMAIALALSMVILLRGDADRRALRGRLIAGLLAACWLWVGIAFHLRSYATINWAARYFGYLFIAQAALFLWGGVVRARLTFAWSTRAAGRVALGLFVSALVLYPLATLAAGRSWQQVELFGLTSDATAVGTLGLLGLASPPGSRLLLIVPVTMCIAGGLTLVALESPEAWVPLVGGVVGIVASWKGRSQAAN